MAFAKVSKGLTDSDFTFSRLRVVLGISPFSAEVVFRISPFFLRLGERVPVLFPQDSVEIDIARPL